jgi:hypothetical protein
MESTVPWNPCGCYHTPPCTWGSGTVQYGKGTVQSRAMIRPPSSLLPDMSLYLRVMCALPQDPVARSYSPGFWCTDSTCCASVLLHHCSPPPRAGCRRRCLGPWALYCIKSPESQRLEVISVKFDAFRQTACSPYKLNYIASIQCPTMIGWTHSIPNRRPDV